ncbi:MAG: hypothetical protein H7840_02440 [Alphaproteobacteria bacterium]
MSPIPKDPLRLSPLPEIDVGTAGHHVIMHSASDLARVLLATGRRRYGRLGLRLGDALSRRWLERTRNPYLPDIAAMAGGLGEDGIFLLNLSHEWACTAGVAPDPGGTGSRLLRVLDWSQEGLGACLVVARHASPAGPFLSATWPGFAGVATAMAPGRFSAAFNQTPVPARGLGPVGDWVHQRVTMWRSSGLPPAHLLRRVFETCTTYDAALEELRDGPLCVPVLFTLSGIEPGEGCVIERTADRAFVHPAPVAAANHWLTRGCDGRPRGQNSHVRAEVMEWLCVEMAGESLSWLRPPILNPTTRVVAEANAALNRLVVQGWEKSGPVTVLWRGGV